MWKKLSLIAFISTLAFNTSCSVPPLSNGNINIQNSTILTQPDQIPFEYKFNGNVNWAIWDYNKWAFFPTLFRYSEINALPEYVSLRTSKLNSPVDAFGATYNYCGIEISTQRFFGYGKFTARMRPRIVSGTVGAFFLMNTYETGHWLHKEIDIEFLGKDKHAIQLNTHRFYQDTESAYGSPYIYKSSFDYSADFHDYSIIWTSTKITWQIDGKTIYESAKKIPDVHLNIRLCNCVYGVPELPWGNNWAGPLDDSKLPGFIDYAWVKYEPQ